MGEHLRVAFTMMALLCAVSCIHFYKPELVFKPGTTKLVVESMSVEHLTKDHLKNLNDDLTFLNISRSSIGSIDKFAFDHLKHLNLLDLSDNEIRSEIHEDTFSRLAGLQLLLLKNLRLNRVRLNLTNVQDLILSGNELETLGKNWIRGDNINYLDLSRNRITKLTESLSSLPKLSTIDISKNKLTHIAEGVFESNANLFTILASENSLESTEGLRISSLKTLDLFANRMTALNAKSFAGMEALEELVLAFNHIKTVQNPFDHLLELKHLNLAWNQIEEIESSIFQNNLYLNRLSLQGNKIKVLKKFNSLLHHLEYLDLSHNQIETIDTDFFTSVPKLTVLDVSFNKLKVFSHVLTPLGSLKVLNAGYNDLSLGGQEFVANAALVRLNLTSNRLQKGLTLFEHNQKLRFLDVSNNEISNLCDSRVLSKSLMKINVMGNRIEDLSCLNPKNLTDLCEVEIRRNPLVCNTDLDDLMHSFAYKKVWPYNKPPFAGSDVSWNQCKEVSVNESFHLWNKIKRNACPDGADLNIDAKRVQEEDEDEDEDEDTRESSSQEESNATNPPKKYFLVKPIHWIRKDDIVKGKHEDPQSERLSWEQIDSHKEEIDNLEEDEPQGKRKPHYSWYTVAIVLIGLSLALTCFNLAVFLYIRLKVWKKSEPTCPQKYTFLHNEIYKNTTEPTHVEIPREAERFVDNRTKNKLLFPYGKMNEMFVNFGLNKKDKDSESATNILVET